MRYKMISYKGREKRKRMSFLYLEQPADFFVLRRISSTSKEKEASKYEVVSELLKGLVILKDPFSSDGDNNSDSDSEDEEEKVTKPKAIGYLSGGAVIPLSEAQKQDETLLKHFTPSSEEELDSFTLTPIKGKKELYRVVGGPLEGMAVYIPDDQDPEDDTVPVVKWFIKDGKLIPLSAEQKKDPLLLKYFTLAKMCEYVRTRGSRAGMPCGNPLKDEANFCSSCSKAGARKTLKAAGEREEARLDLSTEEKKDSLPFRSAFKNRRDISGTCERKFIRGSRKDMPCGKNVYDGGKYCSNCSKRVEAAEKKALGTCTNPIYGLGGIGVCGKDVYSQGGICQDCQTCKEKKQEEAEVEGINLEPLPEKGRYVGKNGIYEGLVCEFDPEDEDPSVKPLALGYLKNGVLEPLSGAQKKVLELLGDFATSKP